MRKRRTLKYWIGQLHLWLGLASGLVVLIVSLTGCLFVFQQEISEVLHKEWFFVKPSSDGPLALSILEEKAQAVLGPGRPVNSITAYPQPDRSWEFMAYRQNDSALTYFGAVDYYQSVFLNPYTGAVTGWRDYKYDFFFIVKDLHWSLLLNTPYGQPIVSWSTLIFVILLISGIVLWWPKKWTKAWRDRSFKIKWNASFKRVNYDLHNVPGFYSLLPALIISYTGLVFAFSWLSPAPAPQIVKRSDTTGLATIADPLEKALQTAKYRLPEASRFALSPAAGKEGVIYLYAYKGRDTYYGYDILRFDRYSGVLLDHNRDKEKKAVQRLFEKNYDIHVGAIGGLTGKIIAFIASLICASLPVTGFLIWWGKRKKKSSQSKRGSINQSIPLV
jgi:uncharacterized iron-regulated membrane protein